MKCKECKYHPDYEVCYGACGRANQLHDNLCYVTRERPGMDEATCVWNCDFCSKNRGQEANDE